jgi:hypothetical protein
MIIPPLSLVFDPTQAGTYSLDVECYRSSQQKSSHGRRATDISCTTARAAHMYAFHERFEKSLLTTGTPTPPSNCVSRV